MTMEGTAEQRPRGLAVGRFGRYGPVEILGYFGFASGTSALPRDDTVLKKVVGDVVGRKWVVGGELEWDVMGLGEL
jgi:hypothetical protein